MTTPQFAALPIYDFPQPEPPQVDRQLVEAVEAQEALQELAGGLNQTVRRRMTVHSQPARREGKRHRQQVLAAKIKSAGVRSAAGLAGRK
jgi:hypothetical protein